MRRAYAQMKRAKKQKPKFIQDYLAFSKWYLTLSEKDKARFRKARDKKKERFWKEKRQQKKRNLRRETQ